MSLAKRPITSVINLASPNSIAFATPLTFPLANASMASVMAGGNMIVDSAKKTMMSWVTSRSLILMLSHRLMIALMNTAPRIRTRD